jgi:hypothetical protein
MRYQTVFTALLAGVCTLAIRCTVSTNLAGGTDMPNESRTIIAAIRDTAGNPVVGAVVSLVPSDYVVPPRNSLGKIQSHFAQTATGPDGKFVIDSVDSGTYSIEVDDLHTAACRIHCSVGAAPCTTLLGTRILFPYAAITGVIDTAGTQKKQLYIQIYGLNRLVLVDEKGAFLINGLPADTFSLRLVSEDIALVPVPLRQVVAAPGSSIQVIQPAWRYCRTLILNTTASGAGVAGNVTGFPVLIRLTSTNFDFSQARKNGQDVRFTKSDNTPLPFEIEQWDSAGAAAEIWVRVDTVYGNDNTHSMAMLWGNSASSVTALSNAAATFDTAAGFKAVLHLDGNCNDATYGRRNGTGYGATDTAGMIGSAKKFHGSDSIRIQGLMDQMQTLTLSAWTQLDVDGTLGADVISIGDNIMLRMDDIRNGTFGTLGAMYFSTDSGWANALSGKYLAGTGWHYLVYACDAAAGHAQSLYIDGVPCGITSNANPVIYSHLGVNTLIGTHGNGQNNYGFTGRIDEVRICKVARSADWVRLCYMNQKAADALVIAR